MTMMRNWPTGSARRERGARESGTNSAVSETAARPTGMFAPKKPRQPTAPTPTRPRRGPGRSPKERPEPAAPAPARRGALAPPGERVRDDAEGSRVEHRAAD